MSKSELSLISGISDVSTGTITIDGSTNGILNLDSTTVGGTLNGTITTPWYPYYSYSSPFPIAELEIRQVSNGFVLKKHGTEYVFESVKDMLTWIEKNYKEKKK